MEVIYIPAMTYAKTSGVIMTSIPPHTSHKMQPLDKTVFSPFKSEYFQASGEWMATPGNHEKPVTIYDVAQLVGKAYAKAFTPANILIGVLVTGIYPLTQILFKEEEFVSSNL
ncbi:hypothetical protein JTE90_008577 [Oedothorax gibbosus]|uniref:DDE-1 domain-containing protein n=1 Tax=Oedothorax gibbosus TaxID=931172 RepID=A0AAV6TK21_9ARAC|nr:hypothetical protein JTE90_008577 [Oedothorax gibbosus]